MKGIIKIESILDLRCDGVITILRRYKGKQKAIFDKDPIFFDLCINCIFKKYTITFYMLNLKLHL